MLKEQYYIKNWDSKIQRKKEIKRAILQKNLRFKETEKYDANLVVKFGY